MSPAKRFVPGFSPPARRANVCVRVGREARELASLNYVKFRANDLFGVQVLNLTQGSTRKESQLYHHRVPEANAEAAVVVLGFVALAGLRRKGIRTF
jgi:hypothetical protein